MNENNSKIELSIITAAFNSANSIEATFRSILDQDFRDFEYIVVDGNSSDGTIELIKKFENDFYSAGIDFKWISEKDTGIYHAWNKGLKMANGEWVAFLGSDDQYVPNALTKYLKVARKFPEADFICAKAKLLDESKLVRTFGKDFDWPEFKREMKILHAGSFHNSKYFDQFGVFDENFQICGDYEMLLRKGGSLRVKFIEEFMVLMQVGGVSSANELKALKEARLAKLKHKIQGKLTSNIGMIIIMLKSKLGKFKRSFLSNAKP